MNLELTGVSRWYGKTRALFDVRLDFEPGRIVAVVGLNGAGKSTLLHAIAGLIRLDRGEILFDGEPLRRDRVDQRRRFGFLPDFPFFFEGMEVIEHLAMVLRLYGHDGEGSQERTLDLLKAFSLLKHARQPMEMLSRGERYKAALSGLIAAGPELWLLDEPMASGMDGLGLSAFRRYAREAAQYGATVIYTTQILPVAEAFSDEVVILHEGEVHARGPAATLRAEGGGGLEGLLEELSHS